MLATTKDSWIWWHWVATHWKPGVEFSRHDDELPVDIVNFRIILFIDLDLDVRMVLEPLQNIEPPPAARALTGVARIGDVLQFLEDKASYD